MAVAVAFLHGRSCGWFGCRHGLRTSEALQRVADNTCCAHMGGNGNQFKPGWVSDSLNLWRKTLNVASNAADLLGIQAKALLKTLAKHLDRLVATFCRHSGQWPCLGIQHV